MHHLSVPQQIRTLRKLLSDLEVTGLDRFSSARLKTDPSFAELHRKDLEAALNLRASKAFGCDVEVVVTDDQEDSTDWDRFRIVIYHMGAVWFYCVLDYGAFGLSKGARTKKWKAGFRPHIAESYQKWRDNENAIKKMLREGRTEL